jgi:hypothetical protein
MKVFFALCLGLLFSVREGAAQLRLAILSPGGAGLYLAPQKDAKRVPIAAGSFLYCEKSAQAWWKAQSVTDHQEGYVPAGAASLLHELPLAGQRAIFAQVFGAYRQLADSMRLAIEQKATPDRQTKARQALELYTEENFDPVLGEFAEYFRRGKDTTTLQQLLVALWADQGAQSEMPSVALAECLADHPEAVLATLRQFEGQALNYLLDLVEHGLDNQIHHDEREQLSTDQQAQLKAQLAILRN